ncbi:MAG: adenylate/guanylate cyclase domain-containing protein [Ardenticatenia bacterium]|nr:adenylate/guanylate cyclase domain-containing protein [Ardenticatenia bacterium]
MLLLQDANRRLRTYAEWSFGKRLFRELLNNPQAGNPRRQHRTIFFSDVRGFTAWSEKRTPEAVMEILQAWYLAAEKVWEQCEPVHYKFTADEVMAVFASVEEAARAAILFHSASRSIWEPHGLHVGIGIHWGAVVEGLIGGREVKFYDVIGDTVNTAQRIEKGASKGQILISEKAYRHLPPEKFEAGPTMRISVKDKAHLEVRVLHTRTEQETVAEYMEAQEVSA